MRAKHSLQGNRTSPAGNSGAVTTLLAVALLLLAVLPSSAQDQDTTKIIPQRVEERFPMQSHAGIRLGVWSHLGDEPIPSDTAEDGSFYQTDLHDGSFYFEAYFGLRLHRLFVAELSLGWVSRGDVAVVVQNDEFIGNLVAYPIELRGKFYLLGNHNAQLQPYVLGGIGVFHVRNDIQFVTTDDIFLNFRGDSETDFMWVVGGGVDWPLARPIALDLQGTYRPIRLSRDFFSMKDHDALTITVGIKYLLPLEETRR